MTYETIVIGQGLAGTALAWWLRWFGQRVLVIDRRERVTASRAAAGLLTPITGRRLAHTAGWERYWPAAVEFYRRIEAEAGERFFFEKPMVRLFTSAAERALFQQRSEDLQFRRLVREPSAPVQQGALADPLGGFEMVEAGRLDVSRYLEASRRLFGEEVCMTADVDVRSDLEIRDQGVVLSRLGVTGKRLIFCQGFAGAGNRWTSSVRFNPAKGEILTLQIPGLAEERVVHRGIWLAPADEGCFRLGATYQWEQLDQIPTQEGREQLCGRLRELTPLPFEVMDHVAAVRPALHDFRPVLGVHPREPRIGIFNGLGSKGTLLAPLLARELATFLSGEGELEPELDWKRWFR